MKQHTSGFTLIELLIVIVIMGIMATIALPKLSQRTNTLTVRSSAQQVAAYLARARATAIATGRPAWFVRSGNVVGVSTTSDTTAFVQSTDLQAEHGVSVSALLDPTKIEFDARGMIPGGVGAVLPIVVTKNGVRDSVCVIGMGRISIKDCSL